MFVCCSIYHNSVLTEWFSNVLSWKQLKKMIKGLGWENIRQKKRRPNYISNQII
jgi:hypothetical protein